MDNGQGEWVSLGEAARRLGVTRAAVYGRKERGTLQTRPNGNRGLGVLWPPPQRHHNGNGNGKDDVALTIMGDGAHDGNGDILLADLRERLDRAEQDLEAVRAQVADLRVQLATARAEREAARAVAIADVATAQAETVARDQIIADLRERVAWLRLPWWQRWIGSH
jgi:hypothetical protein